MEAMPTSTANVQTVNTKVPKTQQAQGYFSALASKAAGYIKGITLFSSESKSKTLKEKVVELLNSDQPGVDQQLAAI